MRLEVEEADGWVPWEEVRTLATSQALDRHYTVELDTGLVRFGLRSRVPQLGERIRAVTYRHGGGSAGQVPAGAITSLVGVASVKVTNPVPAVGGDDVAAEEPDDHRGQRGERGSGRQPVRNRIPA